MSYKTEMQWIGYTGAICASSRTGRSECNHTVQASQQAMTIPTRPGSLCAASLSCDTRSSTGSMKVSNESVSIRFTNPAGT